MKLLLCGYYGFKNTGDEAILETLVEGFRERAPNIDITVLSNNPTQTKKRYNVKSFGRNNLIKIIQTLKQVDGFVLGGGGLLQDVTSRRSFFYYAGLVYIAQKLGVKTFIIAQGMGPIKSRINRWVLKTIIEKSTVVTVREKDSYNFVKSLKTQGTLLIETIDPSLSLRPSSADYLAKKEKIDLKKKPIFGISVRYYKGWQKAVPEITKAIRQIAVDHNAKLIFIPFQINQDIHASQEIIKNLDYPATIIQREYSPNEILGLIKKMDFLLGMRLHSLIFAVSASVPAMGISYDPKIQSFMDIVALPWIDLKSIKADRIVQSTNQLLENREGVKKSLDFIRRKMYGKTILNFDGVMTPLMQKG